MAQLTTFSRLLITLAIIAAVFFGIRYLFPNLGHSAPASTEQNGNMPTADRPADANTAPSSGSSDWGKSSPANFNPAPFNYSAKEPVNGKLKGEKVPEGWL